jgi:hypothetical protein
MFQPTWPSSGVLKLVGGTAASSYAVRIDVFFTITIHLKIEVHVVSLKNLTSEFQNSVCAA